MTADTYLKKSKIAPRNGFILEGFLALYVVLLFFFFFFFFLGGGGGGRSLWKLAWGIEEY